MAQDHEAAFRQGDRGLGRPCQVTKLNRAIFVQPAIVTVALFRHAAPQRRAVLIGDASRPKIGSRHFASLPIRLV